ncbi:SDR family NAD(P)-dependent oxidoreductase [Variovorax boronicumulans]|uniref:SDR family NAD(P)-dependent oxidoreductase n=1 Tax=Variovorax boronicumulans TaxID=436515 RepID=UPI001C572AA4
MRFTDKVAIVSGAQTGIGLAIAQRLASEGAAVVLADIADAGAQARALQEAGARALALTADVADEASVQGLVERTVAEFGRVDILVNNAAIASRIQLRPFEEIPVAEWRRMQDVNAMGPFLLARAVSPHMRARQSGRIVNITSGTAFKGAPFMLDYVASKGALMTMTRALARELGPSFITVNAVSPGYTLSEGNLANEAFLARYRASAIATRALPRDGWPEDIVGAVAFLASDDAAFISGQILAVDGGSVYH